MLTDTEFAPTTVEARWGRNVARGAYGSGWAVVPSAFIRNIGNLKLHPTEVTVLLSILVHYWSRDKMPIPRVSTIAKQLGLSRRTIERTLNSLDEKGFINREERTETDAGMRRKIDLTGLIEIVDRLAKEAIAPNRQKAVAIEKPSGEDGKEKVPF